MSENQTSSPYPVQQTVYKSSGAVSVTDLIAAIWRLPDRLYAADIMPKFLSSRSCSGAIQVSGLYLFFTYSKESRFDAVGSRSYRRISNLPVESKLISLHCASQNVSPSNWQLWRIDPSTAPLRVSPVLPIWHPNDGSSLLPHIVWKFRPFVYMQLASGRFRFLDSRLNDKD